MRRIVANLDCELAWARLRTPGPHKALPRAVRKRVACASLHLAVFARPGDELWILEPLSTTEAAPGIRTVSGRLEELPPRPSLLWGQSLEKLSALPATDSKHWQDQLWSLRCSNATAAGVNDRRFARDLSRDLGDELDTRVVHDLEELDSTLASMPLGEGDAWVAKAPFSASGRERVRRRGRILRGEYRIRTERLLSRYGALIIEPWHTRADDFGTVGLVSDTSVLTFPPHRLVCDTGGEFRAIEIDSSLRCPNALAESARGAGAALQEKGYRGPFSVDSYTYREGSSLQCRAICEINARMSFGLVARARFEASQGRQALLEV